MRQQVSAFAVLLASLALTGCPPTGEPPPFDPIVPDAQPADVGPDAAVDPCADLDGDGYVVGEGCALPSGDCAPEDGDRNPGAREICNLRDDNCDGASDEGDPGGGERCQTDAPGICADGLTACVQGAVVCEQTVQPNGDEICDGRDDDCDGEVDESVPGLGSRCDTGDEGVCAVGAEACVGGRVQCAAAVAASPEQCNGSDDDCDGETDEGDPQGGGACDTGLDGVCAVGVEQCANGDLACMTTVQPTPEICNRLDDDCDGATDETFPDLGAACVVGTGACERASTYVCDPSGERVICDATAGDGSVEACNGVDDDCDGSVDEGYALGEACTNGLGACQRPGATICNRTEDGVVCDAVPGEAFDETCNGADDDCDGDVDETFPTLGDACVNNDGQCPSPGSLICSPNGLGTTCNAVPVNPEPETCNDFDDDCDGSVDEAFPAKGEACQVGVGLCERAGEQVCAAGGQGLTCSAEPGAPAAEACNALDDDCDGRVDNGAPCVGPPAGVVVGARIAEFGEAVCGDLTGDGVPDNGLGAVAGLFNPGLRVRFREGSSPMIVRAPGFPDSPLTVEWLRALTVDGAVAPAPDSLTPAGTARERLADVIYADGVLSGGTPGALSIGSPLFHADSDGASYVAARQINLRAATARGALAAGAAGGLTSDALVVQGWVPRAALLAAYTDADAACAVDGAAAPAGCQGRVSAAVLSANLQADLDMDPAVPGPDAVSVCLVFEVADSLPPASNPAAGPIPCEADGDCYQGLGCRALPWLADGAPGAALEQRCGLPGAGGAAFGAACATHEDCRGGLCVAATAGGGRCTALCDNDMECPAAHSCRGVPVPDVPGAVDQGGRSAKACIPLTGSDVACAGGDCPEGEVCTPWLADGAGMAGGEVQLNPRCTALDPAGAALGAACDAPTDCARGLGCVAGLDGGLVCAPTCDASEDCGAGTVCVDRPFLAAAGEQPALQHGVCLAVPEGLGSGDACTADAGCAPGEICAASWLNRSRTHSRWCAAGEGFFSVGQPCGADADCASGACLGGRCTGSCETTDDCGDPHGCVPNAWADAEGRIIGGGCGPVDAGCLRDRDCNQADPLCAGDRCVCDAGACRLGCRAGGVCADGDWCQPDGVCATFCRDDDSEPNDTVGTATLLGAGRAAPSLVHTAELCGRSPIDWYAFSAGGQPFTARLVPLSNVAAFEFGLFDAAGGLIAEGTPGNQPGSFEVVFDDPQAAAARLGQNLALRVRASGTFDQVAYRVEIDVTFPECPDPAVEPRDASWEATELLTAPGLLADETADAWICPQDTDWYGMFLGEGDEVTLSLVNHGNGVNGADALDVSLLGPDFPEVGRARLLGRPTEAQPLTYTVPQMFCDPNTSFCALADGTATDVFCGGDDADCYGMPYFVRVRGAGAFDYTDYQLQVQVQRAQAVDCVPDLYEHDGNFQLLNRVQGALPPALRAFDAGRPTLPIGQQVDITGLRACGGVGPINEALDADNFMMWLQPGEQVVTLITQAGNQRLQLDTYRVNQAIERLTAVASTDQQILGSIDANVSGFYAVGVLRAGDEGQAGYTVTTPYTLSMVRLPFGFVPDTACEAPVRVNLVNGVAEVTGTTQGANDDHRPLDCLGGTGPDRVYAVRVPAGAGVLRATVIADEGDGYDPAVSLRTDCAVENSELACNDDDASAPDPFTQAKAQAVVQGGAVGRDIFVIVDSHSAQTAGRFRVLLRYIDGDQCDLNTGVCADPCEGVACPGQQACDPEDGQCVDCFVDGQCGAGERCVDRTCIGGAGRAISDWGPAGDNEPNCVLPSECTPDEQCSPIPFTVDSYCLMPCNDTLICPDDFVCCTPPLPVGPGSFCVPTVQPLRGVCE